jgi:hypothetical protein
LVAVGRLQDMVMLWMPAAWLNIRRAFKPLARQRSYSDEKSALETAGCGVGPDGAGCVVGQAGTPAPAPSPLTTLAHVAVGETREVGGREGVCNGWHPAGPAGSPATPEEGEAGRARRVDHPRPLRGVGGKQVAGRASECRSGAPYPARVSSELDKGYQRTSNQFDNNNNNNRFIPHPD